MSISPIGPGNPITRLQGSTAVRGTQGSQDVDTGATDTVEISDVARYLSEIKKLGVRDDKVEAAKAKIADGSYDSPEVLDKVVNEIQEDLR